MPDRGGRKVPPLPRALGAAGLLPQGVAALLGALDPPALRAASLILASAYGALILSFLGGLWWGLAAATPAPPRWIWVAAVVPSLWALAALTIGLAWGAPVLALAMLAAAILASPLIDGALVALAVAPDWWMRLRVPLSIGLGILTVITAGLAWR